MNVVNNLKSLNQNWEVLFVPKNGKGSQMPYNFKSNLNSIIDRNPKWSPDKKRELMRGTFNMLIEILHDISQNHNPNLRFIGHRTTIDEIHRNKMRASYKLDPSTEQKGQGLEIIKKDRKLDLNILRGNEKIFCTDMRITINHEHKCDPSEIQNQSVSNTRKKERTSFQIAWT